MAAPNLAIAIEPQEGTNVTYLPLAPARAGATARLKLVIRLRITNDEARTVTVTGIRFSFPGTRRLPIDMEGVSLAIDPAGDVGAAAGGGRIDAGTTATWSNGRVDLDTSEAGKDMRDNMVYLDGTPPTQLRVHVTCSGFSDPCVVTRTLVPTALATPTAAFLLPFASGDLRDDEYVVASAKHWANGGANGTQIFAHDISIEAVSGGKWSELLPGKSSSKNDAYRIWGKPVRAMADGVVEAVVDGIDTNTVLGDFPDDVVEGAGNHFWLRHGDLYTVYAHLQEGTLTPSLTVGAAVRAGQQLGLAGNSGRATNPHLHIMCVRGSTNGTLRGLPFRSARTIERDAFTPPTATDPWAPMAGHGISKDTAAMWPGTTTPGFPIPAAGIARAGDWGNSYWTSTSRAAFEKAAQDLFEQKQRRLVWATTYRDNGHRRWVGIARAGDWASAVWTSSSRAAFEKKAQALFTNEKKRLIHVHTYLDGATRYWMGIARSGSWSSAFWVSSSRAAFEAKAQALFTDEGKRLTFVHTYPEGGKRYWVGIAQGGTWANSFWISEGLGAFRTEAQRLFDEKGRRLVHVHSYEEGGKRYWVGISRAGDWGNAFWYSKDLDSFNRTAQDRYDDDGYRLAAVEFLDV